MNLKNKIINSYYFKKYYKYGIIIICCIPLVFIINLINFNKKSIQETIKKEPIIAVKEEKKEIIEKIIKVDIKGAVTNPGVYEVKEKDRIIDLIGYAGGMLENANTDKVNFSKYLQDEMMIVIPFKKENITLETKGYIEEYDNVEDENELTEKNDKVSINEATLEELMTLNGIGEAKASSIIEYRKNKQFETIEELTEIKGIGISIFEKIKDNITL